MKIKVTISTEGNAINTEKSMTFDKKLLALNPASVIQKIIEMLNIRGSIVEVNKDIFDLFENEGSSEYDD